jgi:predicted ATPase/DNA-binding CsgD family transcriptional regulator
MGDAAGPVAGEVRGFVPALTSFVGREPEVGKVAGLLGEFRLVTVTGPGGVGKTRLAVEVARRVAGRFADGVWLVELAAVFDQALVPAAVAAALGIRQPPGTPVVESLAAALGRQQRLLVLDNCEHLLEAVAQLCATLLPAADDVRVLATSREPLGLAGEARYRLPPLTLPEPGDPAGTAASEAVTLFADRARQADPEFGLTGESGPLVAQIVARLDGMPLAIELAAARAEALGLAQLLDRLDHRFTLLTGSDRTASPRQRSLAATVDWSYQLLSDPERQVFRRLAVFPGPFTLDAAEAVAGTAAEPVVLHLVDCSLLAPPSTGPDGRARYLMVETLRAYGLERLAEASEQAGASAALAGHALQVAEQAAAGLETSAGELAATRLLEAEDATVHQGLAWALDHDHGTALRLALALAPWWFVRGRWASGYQQLAAAAGPAAAGGEAWCAAQYWLGALTSGWDVTTSFGHFTAARDALAERAPVPLLARTLPWRAATLANLDRLPEAAEEAHRALAMARELGDRPSKAGALYWLGATAAYAGDFGDCVAWLRQTQRIDRAAVPGWITRQVTLQLAEALGEAGEAAEAQQHCADLLAQARQAGALYDQADCLVVMARLDVVAGRLAEARAHLRQALELVPQTSASIFLLNCLELCGQLCTTAGRWREAITVWAAFEATMQAGRMRLGDVADKAQRREALLRARKALQPALARAAEERGAAMTPAAAADYALLLAAEEPGGPTAPAALPRLSAREQELVTLVARGRTDAQIAGQLYISLRTVRSHLDRIRDKTGSRRRADLTRLALQAGLV